jgi:hypothetical protein
VSADLKADLAAGIGSVMKDWKTAKKRQDRVSRQQLGRLRQYRPPRYTVRDAAFDAMEAAYLKASGDGKFYANARQIMYAARPLVLEATGGECWRQSSYFTQKLLKDYLEAFEPDWKVVWDARGHLHEPHTRLEVNLGGVGVTNYMRDWKDSVDEAVGAAVPVRVDTTGPALRYGTALFVEKEGFTPILDDAGLAERFDLAVLSTKGLSTKAACDLLHGLHLKGVKILAAHDFDLAGFKIVRTLRRGTRLAPGAPVVDIGLRMGDVAGLQAEEVSYSQRRDPRDYLRRCGATESEIAFLVSRGSWRGWDGERVELNALASDELITWLETKLQEHGVKKVVPEAPELAAAYRRAVFRQRLEAVSEEIAAGLAGVEPPRGLAERVRAILDVEPRTSWDEAVAEIAEDDADD